MFDENGQVVIAGKIINHEKYPDINTIKITIDDFAIPLMRTHIAYLDENGDFIFRFEKYLPQDIYLTYGRMYGKWIRLFISPGDSLYLKFNADEFINPDPENYYLTETVKFSGDAVQINEDLTSFLSEYRKQMSQDGSNKEKTLSPNEYKSYLMTKREKDKQYLQTFIKSHKPCQTFINWAHFYIDYTCGDKLLHYTWSHPFTNKKQKGKIFEVMDLPESYYSFLDQLPLDNKPSFICSSYKRFLHNHSLVLYSYGSQFFNKHMQGGEKFIKSKDFQSEYRKYLNSLVKQYPGSARDHLLSKKLYSLLESYERIDVFEELYPRYEKMINKCFKKTIQKKYTELKLAEKSPGRSYNFKQKEHTGESTSGPIFQQVLDKHQRKVIYIDIWATWCGPCLVEIPFSLKLQNEFKGKEVAFVYLCVKSKKSKWESTISDYNVKGDLYLLSDSQYDVLSEKFQISGIPRYILINKDGVVVDKNAQRPSFAGELNTDLINEINSLIED